MYKLKVLIAGSTGYIGVQLVKLLSNHQNINIKYLCGNSSVGKKISFFDFYLIFRDLLLGITNMNSNYLTHGDIKPSNILYFNGMFCLCDYGTGRNLFYESRNANKLYF